MNTEYSFAFEGGGCFWANPGCKKELHAHASYQISLFEGGPFEVSTGGRQLSVVGNSLVYHRPGEPHGFHNPTRESVPVWVLRFRPGSVAYALFPALSNPKWSANAQTLSSAQALRFKGYLLKLVSECAVRSIGHEEAQNAWLRLFLVEWNRLSLGERLPLSDVSLPEADVVSYWERSHVDSARPLSDMESDALRKKFAAWFGLSPKALQKLNRLELAKQALAETSQPIKLISDALGFPNRQEFTRFFTRETGHPPARWRSHPEIWAEKNPK